MVKYMKNMFSGKSAIIYAIFALSIVASNVEAAWTGPVTIITGAWGQDSNQFYVDWGDTPAYAIYPVLWDISDNGNIAVADNGNGRVKIYGADGTLLSNITPPVTQPKMRSYEPAFVGNNVVIPVDKYYFYTLAGNLVAQIQGPNYSD
jgi:hypothetical protein